MVTTCYGTSITSNLEMLRYEISNILKFIKHELPNLSEEDLFDLRIIYSELLVNAIIHGNKKKANKQVELFVEINGLVINSVIKDEGRGFDFRPYIAKNRKSYHIDSIYSEKGRGLNLVRFLSDRLSFNNIGNEVSFVKRVRII